MFSIFSSHFIINNFQYSEYLTYILCQFKYASVPNICIMYGWWTSHPVLTSVCRSFFIFRIRHGEEVLQLPLQCFKCWSLHWVFVPAFHHDVVKSLRTTLRTLHPITIIDLMKHFCIGHT